MYDFKIFSLVIQRGTPNFKVRYPLTFPDNVISYTERNP